jgi:hypothetical protein
MALRFVGTIFRDLLQVTCWPTDGDDTPGDGDGAVRVMYSGWSALWHARFLRGYDACKD